MFCEGRLAARWSKWHAKHLSASRVTFSSRQVSARSFAVFDDAACPLDSATARNNDRPTGRRTRSVHTARERRGGIVGSSSCKSKSVWLGAGETLHGSRDKEQACAGDWRQQRYRIC